MFKTLMDKLIIFILFPLLIPFFLFFTIFIPLYYGFSPFFITKRIGKGGKPFTIYKFQTMYPPKPSDDLLDPKGDKNRITNLGRFMRNRGWDELPQLLNIIKGDMTFIGPRPIMEKAYSKLKKDYPQDIDLIESWWEQRHQILPGLSGWHQIHLLDHNIIKFDQEYLENPTLNKNLQIMFTSMAVLLIGKNVFFGKEIPDTYEYDLD